MLDLGNILGTVGSAYVSARYGQPNSPIPVTPAFNPLLLGGAAGTVAGAATTMLGGETKRRRRRRRLATTSDIKDLAALRSVLGNGEAFKTWIATHPS